jgi:hypothetical protein
VIVPVVAPILIPVAALNASTAVDWFKRLKFVAIEVISPPLTSRSLSNITLPVPT